MGKLNWQSCDRCGGQANGFNCGFTLILAASDNRELAECALERLAVWESQFNRTFVQPSVSEPAELLVLTHRIESRLPAELAKRITFIVQSFTK